MSRPRVAIVLRKSQHGVSIADEHDSERIAAYGRDLGERFELQFQVVAPEARGALTAGAWDAVLFVGADDFAREFIDSADTRRPLFLWAKGYDLTLDPRWSGVLARLDAFFNSSFLSGFEDRYHERTFYIPTAFHDHFPWSAHDTVDDLRNRFAGIERYDLVFSGSDRFVRADRYRQRLLNLLATRGIKICVAAPRDVWNRPHQFDGGEVVPLDPRITILGNWGTPRLFQRAALVLDLPWLDNVFNRHPSHQDPNRSIFALGWNIFRAGAAGARLLTYDCGANRELGLTDEHCLFYHSDLSSLEALAGEIAAKMHEADARADQRRLLLRRLFHDRHTYRHRWQQMVETIDHVIRERAAGRHAVADGTVQVEGGPIGSVQGGARSSTHRSVAARAEVRP